MKPDRQNAMRFFRFDPFKQRSKVDVTPRSSGGVKPAADSEGKRRVTSGDLMRMFAHHAQAGE